MAPLVPELLGSCRLDNKVRLPNIKRKNSVIVVYENLFILADRAKNYIGMLSILSRGE